MQKPLVWWGQRELRGGRRRCGRLTRKSGWERRYGILVWSVDPVSGRQPGPERLLLEGWTSPSAPGWCDHELQTETGGNWGKITFFYPLNDSSQFFPPAGGGRGSEQSEVSASLAADISICACFIWECTRAEQVSEGWELWESEKLTFESFLRKRDVRVCECKRKRKFTSYATKVNKLCTFIRTLWRHTVIAADKSIKQTFMSFTKTQKKEGLPSE